MSFRYRICINKNGLYIVQRRRDHGWLTWMFQWWTASFNYKSQQPVKFGKDSNMPFMQWLHPEEPHYYGCMALFEDSHSAAIALVHLQAIDTEELNAHEWTTVLEEK